MKKTLNLKTIFTSLLICAMMICGFAGLSAITASAADATACETADCSGTYENGFCEAVDGVTHYQAATLTEGKYDIDGDGEKDDVVYEIGNAGQLYWFMEYVNSAELFNDQDDDDVSNDVYTYPAQANAVLTKDIVINPGTFDADGVYTAQDDETLREWFPIGYWFYDDNAEENVFYAGTFDGQGYTISGLYFNNSEQDMVGLFGQINQGAVVKNVGVINSYISGGSIISGVVGENYGGTVENCYNTGTVSGKLGVSGVVCENNGTVKNCYNSGIISGTGNCVAGVAGFNSATIENCYNTGSISGNSLVGGIAGNNFGTVKNCYNIGTVSGTTANVGGVAGKNTGDVTNCYYLDKVGDISNPGGITGKDVEKSAESKTAEQFAFGEVAYLLNGSKSVAADGETLVWGQTLSGEDKDASPVFKTDHNTVYFGYISCADDATMVYSNNSAATAEKPAHDLRDGTGFCSGCDSYEPATLNNNGTADDTSDDYYEISNAGQLYWFMEYVNAGGDNASANAVLTADIVVNEDLMSKITVDGDGNATVKDGEDVREWFPIGYWYNRDGDNIPEAVSYKGNFDGQGHTVSGLYFNNSEQSCVGLFGQTEQGAIIQNVGVINSYISGFDSVGGVVGCNFGTVENCYNTGDVSGSSYVVGGVVGINYVTVKNCYNTGDVSGSSYVVGGVVGINHDTVTNCYYLKDTATNGIGSGSGDTTEMTAEEFASGKVAYLLNGSKSVAEDGETLAWGQTLSGDNKDISPIFKTDSNTVYYGYISCAEDAEEVYSNNSKATETKPEHKDENTDHICDNNCGKQDIAMDQHVDANKDHACDYGCADEIGDHVDANKDHDCDYGCADEIGDHVDANKDHACDYGCADEIGDHADANKDHDCDYGCTVAISEHTYDNACDADCNVCGTVRTPAEHVDADENNVCDECNAELPKDGLSGGAIAGIVVGGVAVLGLGGFAIFWFVIRKKKWSDLVGIFKK